MSAAAESENLHRQNRSSEKPEQKIKQFSEEFWLHSGPQRAI